MEQGTTNFGIQSEQLAEQPPGGVMTNDPSFSPNGTDGPGEIVLPGPPHAGIARQILLPIACALLVLAIMFRVRMHRRLVAQP
jgi:hypothetical protein